MFLESLCLYYFIFYTKIMQDFGAPNPEKKAENHLVHEH